MTVVGATGHQQIPGPAIEFVRTKIGSVLDQSGQFTGVCCLAAGADQLFARAVLERGGFLHAIIPSEGYEATFASKTDRDTYVSLLQRADIVERLPFPRPSEDAFLAGGKRVADEANVIVAIWDGKPARGKGGTADVVAYARERRKRVVVIWPHGLDR